MEYNLELELEKLLKGTHMGIFTFMDLKEKAECKELYEILEESILTFKHHEEQLCKFLQELGKDSPNEKGVDELLSDVVTMVKHFVVHDDHEVAQEALRAIDIGYNALSKFCQKEVLPDSLWKLTGVMKDDYEMVYHKLHKLTLVNE